MYFLTVYEILQDTNNWSVLEQNIRGYENRDLVCIITKQCGLFFTLFILSA